MTKKQKFKVGDKVRVKDRVFDGEDDEFKETIKDLPRTGIIVEIDKKWKYPFTIQFNDASMDEACNDLMFKESDLEKID